MDMDVPAIARDKDIADHELGSVQDQGPALWIGGGLIGVLIAVFYPPTYAIGNWGWLVMGLAAAASMSVPVWQHSHPEAITRPILYMQAWISLGLIVLAQWLVGPAAPVREILLL